MFDLIIIGMGPAGMSAGVYAKRSNLNVLMLESNTPGGNVLKAKTVDNYLGFNNVSGTDLAVSMFNHINELDISYKIEKVLKLDNKNEYKEVITNKDTYKAKRVLITSGKGNNKLFINNNEIKADNISYCALCDGALYKDKDVLLIKENNESDNEEVFLKSNVANLYICSKNDIKEIIILDNLVKKVILKDKELDVSGIFVSGSDEYSTIFDKDLIERKNGKIIVNKQYETNVSGIYAAGDVTDKDLYQISTAVAEGATAAVNIIKDLGGK